MLAAFTNFSIRHLQTEPLPRLFLDRRGNTYLIIICLFNVCILYPGTKAYYTWRNKQKSKIWDAMTSKVRDFWHYYCSHLHGSRFLSYSKKVNTYPPPRTLETEGLILDSLTSLIKLAVW